MTGRTKVLKVYESFILGTCQCGCSTEIPIIKKKDPSRKRGHLKKYLNSAHSLKGKNQSGENNVNWKGGIHIDKDGYIKLLAPNHPFRDVNNRVYQHRLVYEHYLSIILDEQVYLNPTEEIHHINKKVDDNSLINLQYMATKKDHRKEHRKDYDGVVCSICGSDKTSLKENGQPHWMGNEEDGWKCVSCSKKEYYLKNKEYISERKKKRYKLTGKK